MKTEQEFTDFFIAHCRAEPEADAWLQQTAKNSWRDLTTHLHAYFSNEDRLEITAQAASKLSQNLLRLHPDQAWAAVIRDFVQNHHWGFQTILHKPVLKQTEEQKIFWQLFKYVWAFFQSMIVLKIAVYYFGLESAYRPDEISVIWVWFFFSVSVGSLGFFAYRNRHDKD